jgi:hypothetical protein
MDVNRLRTPEGLDYYLNVEINTLKVKVPDFMMKIFLWQKVKFDFLSDEEVNFEESEVNENDTFLEIKVNGNNSSLVVCYFHISDSLHIESDFLKELNLNIVNYIKKIKGHIELNKLPVKAITLITTYKISDYNNIRLDNFPNDLSYAYITESPDILKKIYEISIDTETNEFMEGDRMLKGLLNLGNQYNKFE